MSFEVIIPDPVAEPRSVVFGWIALLAQRSASNTFVVFGVPIPLSLAPFGSLILTQLVVPHASLVVNSDRESLQ